MPPSASPPVRPAAGHRPVRREESQGAPSRLGQAPGRAGRDDQFDRHEVHVDPAGRVRHGIDGSGGRQAAGGGQSHEPAGAGTSSDCPPRPPSIASGSRSRFGSVVTKSRGASFAGLWTIADTRPKPSGMAKVVTAWSTASGNKIRVSSGMRIWAFEQADDHPVVNVTWNDVTAFCQWLSEKESVKCRLASRGAVGVRLPSRDHDDVVFG